MNYADFQFLKFDLTPPGVMLVTINRPEVMNAMNGRLHWEVSKVWGVLHADPNVRVVIITGAGTKAFSTGGDLDWVATLLADGELAAAGMAEASDIVYGMLECSKPIISAINGVAVGAGLAVALLADVSIMSHSARLADPHVNLGVAAGDHAAIIWPLLCGMAKAKYLLLTGDFVDGKEAERIGLVSLSVPAEELQDRAMAMAMKLANGSQMAIRANKRIMNGWMKLVAPIFDRSVAEEHICFLSGDAREGVAAMREKRPATFPSTL
ncbi:MAG: enoyl-CoA hydratase/isomerase family protein [Burkholderiaceae bacterium]|nr:enoyl-CoA hydratase/isomerase family protein [Burkholderiaceae bacterium]MDO9089059.1 enoyl-CoA hydratase/isomerase family protein [Burkholderiaceae bacterium]